MFLLDFFVDALCSHNTHFVYKIPIGTLNFLFMQSKICRRQIIFFNRFSKKHYNGL